MRFLYGQNGLVGFISDGITYIYRKNLFGDIIGIFSGDVFANVLSGTALGTWEEYAVAFLAGAASAGFPKMKNWIDILISPAANQLVKIGTNRQESFDLDKYLYDMALSALTCKIVSNELKEILRSIGSIVREPIKKAFKNG